MTYAQVYEMSQNASLQRRIAAAAAQQGQDNPSAWASLYVLNVCASPGWEDAWAAGLASDQAGADTGAREDVITDAMILAAVQQVRNPSA